MVNPVFVVLCCILFNLSLFLAKYSYMDSRLTHNMSCIGFFGQVGKSSLLGQLRDCIAFGEAL